MKKILSLILTIVLCVSLFACSSGNKASADNSKNSSKKLIMCTAASFPPYEYKDGGDFKGIDVECARLIAKKLGCELEIMDIEFKSLISTITSGKADFAMAGMTVTEDRKKNVDFSLTYQNAIQAIVVPASSDINGPSDLKGKLVGVQTGTTGDIYCSGDENIDEKNLSRYDRIPDGMQALKSGKLDAIVIDDQVAKSLVEEAGSNYVVLDNAYANEEYAIAVKKGNTELLNKINAVLEEIKSNGELKSIVDKYIK